MISPDFLHIGDTVGIVAPANFISKDIIVKASGILEHWGFKVRLARNIYNRYNQFAGHDEERLGALQEFLDDDNIKAIICARGGYGTTRIMDELSFEKFTVKPKWLVGFSDITALLLKVSNLGIECVHGPMPITFDEENDPDSLSYLKSILTGNELFEYRFDPHPLNVSGIAIGNIIGGNVSLLSHNIGTGTDFNTEESILFIEETEEYLYRLDRMVLQLQRSRKFSSVAGLIVGHMTFMKENDLPFGKSPFEIILDHISGLGIPVCFGAPIGHSTPNYPLIIGRKAQLKVSGDEVTLSFKK